MSRFLTHSVVRHGAIAARARRYSARKSSSQLSNGAITLQYRYMTELTGMLTVCRPSCAHHGAHTHTSPAFYFIALQSRLKLYPYGTEYSASVSHRSRHVGFCGLFYAALYKNCPRSRIEVRPTASPSTHTLDSAALPHHIACQFATDDVTVEAYYCGHQSVLLRRRSRESCSTYFLH